jgi:hypothetical protein
METIFSPFLSFPKKGMAQLFKVLGFDTLVNEFLSPEDERPLLRVKRN